MGKEKVIKKYTMKTVIIVPAYNESVRLINTVKKILNSSKKNIIIVDDGSRDDTYDLAKKEFKNNERIQLTKHLINLGKGAAMKTGIEKAWCLGYNAVIFIDADGQHNPKYLYKFEKWLKVYPVVFGYRQLNKKMPFIRRYGNIFAAWLIKLLFKINKKDLLSGYLAFRKDVYNKIVWNSTRYGIETEMATKIGKNKVPFKEIKIDTIYIDKYKGVTVLDALKILIQIPFWYFSK